MFIRNLLGILFGLATGFVIITIGITINKALFYPEMEDSILNWKIIYRHWKKIISNAHFTFFLSLLFSAGLASFFGGIITSFVVKTAKAAYAILVGFLLATAAWVDIFFTGHHPFWYIISLNVVLFFFSWFGGKVVETFFNNPRF